MPVPGFNASGLTVFPGPREKRRLMQGGPGPEVPPPATGAEGPLNCAAACAPQILT
jgi:hypothetical protein